MGSTMEKLEKSTVKLSVEVSADKFGTALESAFRKEGKKYFVQGWRKGKTPRKLIEQYYGEDVFYEGAVDELWSDALREAAAEHGIEIIGRPSISIEHIHAGEPLKLAFIVAVYPEIALGDYKGLEIEAAEAKVSAEEIQRQLEEQREARARWIDADRDIKEGDRVTFDFKGKIDGEYFEGGASEKFQLEIGSGQFIPGFEESMIGLPKGENREIKVKFPDDYATEVLAGKNAVFEIYIHEIMEKELPDIDDDLAKDASEFDTLDEWKADIKDKLQVAADKKAKNQLRNEAIMAASDNASLEIPEEMVEIQIDGMVRELQQNLAYQGISMDFYSQLTGETMTQLRDSMRENATTRVKNQLVLEEIIKVEGITASPEDVDKKIEDLAKAYDMPVEEYKKGLKDVEYTYIQEDIAIEKALDMLVDSAKIVAKKKAPAKKAPAKKAPVKKTEATDAAEKPAAKKPAAKKPAVKKAVEADNSEAAAAPPKKAPAKKTAKKTETAEAKPAEKE